MKKKNQAFTLIELLVVISIIAVLMSIMMPALKKAREQAKQTICRSNLKQWGVVCFTYTADSSGYFSKARIGITNSSSPTANDGKSWIWALRPYYADQGKLRLCPSATKSYTEGGKNPFGAWGPYTDPSGNAIEYGSYAFNGWMYNMPKEWESSWHPYANYWRRSDAKGADSVPMMADGSWHNGNPRAGGPAPETEDFDASKMALTGGYEYELARYAVNRHNGVSNIVFMDGSIRKVGLKSLWALKWHRKFDTSAVPARWPDWMGGME